MDEWVIRDDDVSGFVEKGFLRVEGAFSRDLAAECREIMWQDIDGEPDDPATWRSPVVRLGFYGQEPFRAAADSPRLRAAFDAFAGEGRWAPLGGLGTFPVRFRSDQEPGDDGWHVDASFPGDDPADFMSYRVNVASRGRWLLVLFLMSDVGRDDAPTRIRVGSHLDVAALLEPEQEAGLPFVELAGRAASATGHRPVAPATGRAGDVYLCHPFLVHAAQPHRGVEPRFMAQPPLLPEPGRGPGIERPDGGYSPVEAAIRRGLGR
ncbi:phytanoyl-CoA dioxygenase family protein [Streptomyces chitinivorans]|uniref:Phytanoyl-CoA dioxygenase family protein n=1 Tax=Streptomyces chitinivorans TaxID=1257027 RepID=A0ABW7HX18_9ACTN|nr:phytanoyl-CoA dioxygenase family protein [Streptomyces chitinivorans]MDH2409747.1 phytanoyl-CoA dioxygenase family protein [Streptomyces chitinivorans]